MNVLRRHGADPCQQLHYLQMITEKLAKAYFWRNDEGPPRSHASFVRFLCFLGAVRRSERDRVATAFGFQRFQDFRRWIRSILPLAYELERLAPALAGDGPNLEYPWPWEAPEAAPALFCFDICLTSGTNSLIQDGDEVCWKPFDWVY